MSETVTGGEIIVRVLEAFGAEVAFGVISIHNVPILHAMERRGRLRFVPARSESGATNMADGYARVRDVLGVIVSSTGPGAGNASGSMTEALTAGTPLLHLTGQIDSADVDHGRGMNHETADQLSMLRAVSKAAFRVRSAGELARVIAEAAQCALTTPRGPVSVEIPIDIQKMLIAPPAHIPVVGQRPIPADEAAIERLLRLIAEAKRPLLWVGAGARDCRAPLEALLERGFRAVSSVHGRGIIGDDHPGTIGALSNSRAAEAIYPSCDLMVAIGARLRGNDTRAHEMAIPRPLVQIDIDLHAWNRNYLSDLFVLGDAAEALNRIVDRLPSDWRPDPAFAGAFTAMKRAAVDEMHASIGPYAVVCDTLRQAMPRDAIFVRDVTIAANTWGNRLFPMYDWRNSVSALGGGIGQGVQQAIGAALAGDGRKTVVLVGDGGLALNIGELATAVQEDVDLLMIVMNDGGYGVMRNIQSAGYGGKILYSDLYLPDLQNYGRMLGLRTWRVGDAAGFGDLIGKAMEATGPRLLEVDMRSFGAYPVAFAGPRMV